TTIVPSLYTIPPLPSSTLFPYTTLFRSIAAAAHARRDHVRQPAMAREHLRPGLPPDHRIEVAHHPRIGIGAGHRADDVEGIAHIDRKSTRLNSSHVKISYAVFCLKKKND